MYRYVLWFYVSTSLGSMSKKYFAQRFHYTLKLQKHQWNMIQKKHLKLNSIKTTYNDSFKSKLIQLL